MLVMKSSAGESQSPPEPSIVMPAGVISRMSGAAAYPQPSGRRDDEPHSGRDGRCRASDLDAADAPLARSQDAET
jgi:hypothetical protein